MPNKYGLSNSELEIMNIIWNSEQPIYFHTIMEHLKSNGKTWKKQTVHTYLTKLLEKGVLYCQSEGKINAYFVKKTASDLLRERAQTFIDNVFDGSLCQFLCAFTDIKNEYTKDDLEKMKSILDKLDTTNNE